MKKHHKRDQRWLASYLLDGSTYRRLSERWGVGYMTAWRRVERTLDASVDVDIVIASKDMSDVSILLLDAKHFRIHKNKYTLYVSAEALSGRPLAWILLSYSEKRIGYDRLLEVIHTENTPVQAIVSDWHHTIRASVREWYPRVVHQRCAFHALQEVFRTICGKRLIPTPKGKLLWKRVRKIALQCESQKEALVCFRRLQKTYPEHQKAWRKYERALPGIYEWTKRRDLLIPRTSNRIENLMGVIEQRFKSMRTMKNPSQLIKMISAFLKIKYKRPTKK